MENKITFIIAILLGLFTVYPGFTQNTSKTYDEIENTQDKIEHRYIDVYNILDKYPDVKYDYKYEDGQLTGVTITGISDKNDKNQLEVYLIDLEELKNDIYNQSNRMGIYYVSETEPKPKTGYEDFYDKLHKNLFYPESAKDEGIEGTIFVKFVVDSHGNIESTTTSENIEGVRSSIKNALKEAAIEAVEATSGDWEPAKVNGFPVSKWVVLPVQFKLESPYYLPMY